MKIEVYDDDIGKDDFYGEAVVDLNKWLSNPNKEISDYVDIFDKKKKKAGRVLLSIEYQQVGGFNTAKLGY